ncbi:MAG TPA: aminotransferase class I/II-fold pyridoxal phosphate-dependent enzyme [Candidatus Kapabacteria bacterium]|nr:aminotransferase class I/II-fold pyridoxal phosphate-dependent enzyme [Candidatus Kapabacteria bacterium]
MADIFQKCREFTRADDVKEAGYYPYFRAIEENEGPVVRIEGRDIIMAGSNNYLGLTADPRVKEAAIRATEQFGTGCSGSRYLTGTVRLHEELEAELADFMGKEACLLFSTGYQTAQGVIPTLVNRGDYVISDRDNHACIVAGNLMAKGAFGEVVRYKHNDMDDLERQLARLPEGSGKLIVTDGVFSTTGTICELPKMNELAKKYGSRIMVDDAHALGVIGRGGRGTASYFGLEDQTDLTMGTFSKSLASLGGWVVGEERVINYIKHTSPALIFSASPTPASVAAALEALRIMRSEPELLQRLADNANYMRQGFLASGFKIIDGITGVIPVIIGDDTLTFIFWRRLFDAGVFVNAFISPGVMPGMQMMRTSVMATHEKHQLDRILELFEDIGTEMGLLEKETPATAAEQSASEPLPTSGTVTIRTLSSRKERLEFIRMVWGLHKEDPNWVPPLEMDRMRLIDTEKNPFYKHARLRLFVAERKGQVVGRIAAIVNDAHNAVHDDKVGFFGFFESVNDQDVANELVNAASAWLREQGMTAIRGPISPSINDEVGMLVDGFDSPAVMQMPYNKAYYPQLMENAGFAKAKDMLAWMVEYPACLTDRLERVTALLKQRGTATVRSLNMKRFDEEVDRIKTIYNKAWQPNWGFVPMTDEEMNMMAYELKQVIDADLVLFAERDGETVGFALAVPDINQAFKAGSAIPPGAKNLPTAIMNLMTKKKQITQCRIIILGVLPEHQGKGIDALLYREIMERARKKGMMRGEASWVLEDNVMMTRAAEMMNATPYKRYRVFEKPLV